MSVTDWKRDEIRNPPSAQIVRQALSRVIASDLFTRSPQQSKLLCYLCERVLTGSGSELKEYTIAVEAMGLPPNYDQSEASTVRVAIHRLRKRLKTYYVLQGFNDEVQISLDAGEYQPRFCWLDSGESEASDSKGNEGQDFAAATSRSSDSQGPATEMAPSLPGETAAKALLGVEVSKHWRRQYGWRVLIGTVLVLLVASSGYKFRYRHMAGNSAVVTSPNPSQVSYAEQAASHGEAVRILAGERGSEYSDSNGYLWLSDRYYTGGEARDIARTTGEKAPFIKRTNDQVIVRHYREGNIFSYEIPVKPGIYELSLGFVETAFGPDQPMGGGENDRIFTVKINGDNAVDHLDVYSEAGGANIQDTHRFSDVMPSADGKIHLRFGTTSGNPAILSWIQLIPQAGKRSNPLRIINREHAVVDNTGRDWEPDNYYLGGRYSVNPKAVSNTEVPELYKGERFGSFSYDLPVPVGRKYTLTLHFSESYFGAASTDSPQVGAGARVFDVVCNGTVLLRDFDIFKEAGGMNKGISKVFHGLSASSQGKLSLSFIPSHNYAAVNAIEVTEE